MKYDTSEDVFSNKIQLYHTKIKVWRPYISIGDLVEVLEIRTARKRHVATITGIDDDNGTLVVFYGTFIKTKSSLFQKTSSK